MQEITGKHNQNLKEIRAIRSGKVKDYILVEGVRQANEVLRSETKIVRSFFSQDFGKKTGNREIITSLEEKSEVFKTSAKIFDSISDTKTPQGIILICERPETSKVLIEGALQQKNNKHELLLCLHEIRNPSNLGAIFRVAEAAGICGVVITEKSADPFSLKTNRAAMGSNLRLPIWSGGDFETIVDWAVSKGLVTTYADAKPESSYLEATWGVPRLLVFGSEAHGLKPADKDLMDEGISIPMANDVESLNVAVACGIILFEANKNE